LTYLIYVLYCSMKESVKVYRNLRPKKGVKLAFGDKPVFSVQNSKGRVYDWVTEISLMNPVFRVSKKGNERVRKEGRKNVHAKIHGTRMRGKTSTMKGSNWHRITYNPYKHQHFVLADNQSMRVVDAFMVEINGKGVWAFKPTVKEVNPLEV